MPRGGDFSAEVYLQNKLRQVDLCKDGAKAKAAEYRSSFQRRLQGVKYKQNVTDTTNHQNFSAGHAQLEVHWKLQQEKLLNQVGSAELLAVGGMCAFWTAKKHKVMHV